MKTTISIDHPNHAEMLKALAYIRNELIEGYNSSTGKFPSKLEMPFAAQAPVAHQPIAPPLSPRPPIGNGSGRRYDDNDYIAVESPPPTKYAFEVRE